jgi:hypothetical protein
LEERPDTKIMAGYSTPTTSPFEVQLRRAIYFLRHIPSKVKAGVGAGVVFMFVLVALFRASSSPAVDTVSPTKTEADQFWDQNYGER